MRDPITESKTYWLLRWWHPSGQVYYARNCAHYNASRREWNVTEKLSSAYRFSSQSDARRTAKTKAFEDFREGRRQCVRKPGTNYSVYERNLKTIYFWEVVKVTETIVTNFEEEISASNAPAMVQLARAAQ